MLCEQCGAPLYTWAAEEGCLNCLLSTGIDAERTDDILLSNAAPHLYQHYEILTRPDGSRWELGHGAMGVTYKARDVILDTPVALRIINRRFAAQPEARRRFLREAQVAAQMRHPNVASVFHLGAAETGESDWFYAMEFIEGESLEARLRRSGPIPLRFALEVGLQVARALAAAEKRGLVHRDLKPSNIMLVAEEESGVGDRLPGKSGAPWVKVIDFGLAKISTEPGESAGPEGFVGTRAFSSPEQIEGREVDGRSDIYSLGVTLWYALTSKLPFAAGSSADGGEDTRRLPLPVAQLAEVGVSRPVISLLVSMLAFSPKRRPRSASELCRTMEGCLKALPGGDPKTIRPRLGMPRRWLMAGGLGLAAALVGAALYFFPSSPDEKSLAVLPFRNLSSDPANAYFADGIQDDILSRLVRIRELRVISRTGVSVYSADAPRDLQTIGRTLGVRHLLEGSLRREGDKIYLHVSLVDVRDGREIWSEGYNRNLSDAINLQGELAENVAQALDVALSPREALSVRLQPTRNPDAYALYLRGRNLENNPAFALTAYEGAAAFYRQAVALDPRFALAHARLAMTTILLYRYRGPSTELKAQAYAEVAEALRLEPGLGEAHLARGFLYYRIERDFERALPDLATAARLLPNDTEAEMTIAFINRRKGRWKQAMAEQRHALARDPRNKEYEYELHGTTALLRDWPSALEHARRAAELAPHSEILRGEHALAEVWKSGSLVQLQSFFAQLTAYGDPMGNLAWGRWDCAMLGRDFGTARAALDGFPFETLPSVLSAPIPKAYLEGCTWLAQGETAKALEAFNVALPVMEAEMTAHPGDALRHGRLGLLYAYMGRKRDAIREGERAVQITPVSKDAIDGHLLLCNLALIHARVGEAETAVGMIEKLLREPGCISPLTEANMSLWDLRLRWQWDPLRSNPRFQKILSAPEPRTVY
ncbi:MAG: protein kinase [Spartobacteria bacterium]